MANMGQIWSYEARRKKDRGERTGPYDSDCCTEDSVWALGVKSRYCRLIRASIIENTLYILLVKRTARFIIKATGTQSNHCALKNENLTRLSLNGADHHTELQVSPADGIQQHCELRDIMRRRKVDFNPTFQRQSTCEVLPVRS